MMAALLAHARQLAAVSVELHAHQYLKDYYQAFGFRYVRDVEVVGGHQLIEMQMTFGS
ncbi:GNAT family N-acetyltransferase [Gallaecimonas mangrovi]|uniref:GNAT family N-acetyltransferase n=1 Tax=Gallaecimonas mangrovi TaxID=2291597 RepID=UPI00300F8AF1